MGKVFWIKRFLYIAVSVFGVLFVVELLKDRTLSEALLNSGVWSLITAGVFIGARMHHSRKGKHCAICNDTPEMQ